MAYSRWSNSFWYTFWAVSDNKTKDGQIFDICTTMSFTYKQLTEDMDDCVVKVREAIEHEVEDKPEDAVYEELKGYIKTFIKDVEEEYKREQK